MAKITIPVSTIAQLVARMETDYADRIAIRYYDETLEGVREIPYRQYARDIRCQAAALQAAVPDIEGRRVCVLAANSYDYAVSIFGAILSGAVLVPLNLQKSWADIRYELDLVEAAAILHDGRYLEREPALGEAYRDRLLPIDGYKGGQPAAIRECRDRDALMAIMFTSGTTGHSKGVMLSQKNLFAPMPAYCDPFRVMLEEMGVDHYDFCHFTILPMFHIAAFTSLVSWAIMGMCHNLCPDLRNFYRDLALMPSDAMAAVPVVLQSIHRDVMRGRRDRYGRLRILTCGAAACSAEVMLDLMKNGFFIMQMYGLTETAGDGTWNNDQSAVHMASVGRRRAHLPVFHPGRGALHQGRSRHAGLLQGARADRRGAGPGRLVPHRRPGPEGRRRLLLHHRPQKEPDHPGKRRERQPRRTGKAGVRLPGCGGVSGPGKGRPHLRRGLLPGRRAGGGPRPHHRDQPHPAPLQADDRGRVPHRALPQKRHRQDHEITP